MPERGSQGVPDRPEDRPAPPPTVDAALGSPPTVGDAAREADPLVGRTLDEYRIEHLLGFGGTGRVYLAEHTLLGRKRALKVLHPELAAVAAARERFQGEPRLAAATEHPSIVEVYDAGEVDGVPYLVMRYVESDLARLLSREGPLQPERALRLLGQAAAALDAAHANGLVHRDVKPSNILVGPGDRVFLSDFGTAHVAGSERGAGPGAFAGTGAYAAPEQVRGDELDARADVYALACVLYETLTGSPPFVRQLDVQARAAQLEEARPRLTAARPELPAALDEVVARGMAVRAAERYAGCGELVAAAAAAAGVAVPDVPVAGSHDHAPVPSAAAPAWTIRGALPYAAGTFGALSALALLLLLALR